MAKLKKCCFCISLKTGSFIIAIIQVIWAFATSAPRLIFGWVPSGVLGPVVQAFYFLHCVSWIVMAILLLVGAVKESQNFVKIYLVGILILFAIAAVVDVVGSIFLIFAGLIFLLQAAVTIVLVLPEFGLQIYFWFVVYSYNEELSASSGE